VNESDSQRAFLEGISMKQIGKPREANPYSFRKGYDAQVKEERWFDGWDDQDARNRGVQHGVD